MVAERKWTFGLLLAMLAARPAGAESILISPTDTLGAVQAKIQVAKRAKLVFTPGLYTKLTGLRIEPTQVSHVTAHGAAFLLPARQTPGTRMFVIPWHGSGPSPTIVWEGGAYDMNEPQQGRDGFSHEHQSAFYLNATRFDGRLRFTLRDAVLGNSAGDGAYIYNRAQATFENCIVQECFRGGITAGGGANELTLRNIDARGTRLRTGVRLEPSGAESQSLPSLYRIEQLRCTWIDVQLWKGSVLTMSNSSVERMNPSALADGIQGYFFVSEGQAQISDCTFDLVQRIQLRLSGRTKFSNCTFRLGPWRASAAPEAMTALELMWEYQSSAGNANQRVTLADCEFRIADDADPAVTNFVAVKSFANNIRPEERNLLIVKDCDFIGSGWSEAVQTAQSPVKLLIRDSLLNDVELEAGP